MIACKTHTPLRFPFLSLLLLLCTSILPAQPAPHSANDVVLLALEPLNPRAVHQQHARQGLLGNADADSIEQQQLLAIQMHIARETAKFGPVLLLAPDEATKTALQQRCREFQLCDLLHSDRIRMKVVPHDGAWIRDFGPQIDAIGGVAHVVHWRYFDIRAEQAKQEKFQELETARLKLLEARQREDAPDTFSQDSTPDARKAAASTIDDRIYLLREYSQILSEASVQRPNDENAAYDIADAVLATPDFRYTSSPAAIDGGNLFKLSDGRCLTTRALLSRNKDQNIDLDQELQNVAGCRSVTFLEPLPGPVIEHVDMFALPAGGKRILLASYDLSSPFAAEYWPKLTDSERDLALNAELAMQINADRLTRLGYEVVSIPSPFPRISANGRTYYPSVLNALLREGADGSRQLLIPSYQDDQTDIQSAARKRIADAFGPNTEIVAIEATDAAKAQGAIHCLTLTAPLTLSIFNDSPDAAVDRRLDLALKEQLDRNAASAVAAQIPPAGLQGEWAILDPDERSDASPLDLYPQRIFFSQHEFQKGVFDQLESHGTYVIDTRGQTFWSLLFHFADQQTARALVQWLNKDELKLLLDDGDTTLLLKRINSTRTSPFNLATQPSHEAPSASSSSHSTHKNPTLSTSRPPVTLQPVQP